MGSCGYVCPQCEGKGFTDDGEVCSWCGKEVVKTSTEKRKEFWFTNNPTLNQKSNPTGS